MKKMKYQIINDPNALAYWLNLMGVYDFSKIISIRLDRGEYNNFLLTVEESEGKGE